MCSCPDRLTCTSSGVSARSQTRESRLSGLLTTADEFVGPEQRASGCRVADHGLGQTLGGQALHAVEQRPVGFKYGFSLGPEVLKICTGKSGLNRRSMLSRVVEIAHGVNIEIACRVAIGSKPVVGH